MREFQNKAAVFCVRAEGVEEVRVSPAYGDSRGAGGSGKGNYSFCFQGGVENRTSARAPAYKGFNSVKTRNAAFFRAASVRARASGLFSVFPLHTLL
jgi:hypothetical protein